MDRFYTCHCHRCQKVTGSSNAANIFVPSESVNWLGGEEHVTYFELSPDTFFNAAFCSNCGSPLPRQARSGDFVIVPAGSLDGVTLIAPERAIFWDDRAQWFEESCCAPKFAGYDIPMSGS